MPEDRERRSKRMPYVEDDEEFESYYLIGHMETEDEKEYAKEYHRKKTMSEDRERGRKRVHSVAMGYVEDADNDDAYYQNMINESYDAKEYHRNKTMSEDRGRGRKRVHSVAMGYVEADDNHVEADDNHVEADDNHDAYYQNKINELYEKMREKVALRDNLAVQVKVKKSKKSKRPMMTEKKQERKEIEKNHVTQRLENFISNEINGKEVKVVIQKQLYLSDLLQNQNRLNMPMNQLEADDFLTEKEKRNLEKGLEVHLLGPRLQFYNKPMVLTKWKMNSTSNYVLKTNWYNFVEANGEDLKVNTRIQVWSFRVEGELCFCHCMFGHR